MVEGYIGADGYRMIELAEFGSYRADALAVFWMTGKWPRGEVLHINGDRADDRWANLKFELEEGTVE